VMWQRKRY